MSIFLVSKIPINIPFWHSYPKFLACKEALVCSGSTLSLYSKGQWSPRNPRRGLGRVCPLKKTVDSCSALSGCRLTDIYRQFLHLAHHSKKLRLAGCDRRTILVTRTCSGSGRCMGCALWWTWTTFICTAHHHRCKFLHTSAAAADWVTFSADPTFRKQNARLMRQLWS